MSDIDPIFAKLKNAQTLFDSVKLNRIRVFGSMARGDHTAKSDIDLLIDFDRRLSLFELGHVQSTLSQFLGRSVDISTPETLLPALKTKILSEARDI